MFDYLENLRMRPGHVRRRIAAGTAASVTALVAVGWFAVAASSGTFALAPSSSDTAVASNPDTGFGSALAETKSSFTSLLGAAGAGLSSGAPSASGIVIQTQSSTTVDQESPTVIPF